MPAPTDRGGTDHRRRVDAILTRALTFESDGDRAAYLATACADAPEVLAEINALLKTEALSAAAMDRVMGLRDEAMIQAFGVRTGEAGHLVGSLVGEYRITDLIATGGMGAVYKGERADGQFRQTVAIKILPAWAADPQTVARLRAERQILSSLSHPNITQLLSGGETPDGFPYLVTEFIDGVPVTDYVDRRQPDVAERLRLFCDLADAVHHAHTKLVVHRDIKPSNVLVDEDGRPHLLDFGIAKLLDPAETGMTVPPTVAGFSPMTLRYASPEQLDQEAITTASDIYQLGLLLYRLLAGQYPDRDQTDRLAMPPAPGSVAGPSAGIHRDLDTIVLKAIRVAPEQRYASAAELAADVRRYLRGDAISARPESAYDQVRRLARRNPFGAAAAGIILGLIVVWTASVQIYSRQLEIERDYATQQATRAARVKEVLTDIYRRHDPLQADTIGDKRASLWDSLDVAVDQVTRALADEPDIQAELYSIFASIYVGAGRVPEAIDVTRRAERIYAALGEAWFARLAATKADLAGLLMNTDNEQALLLLDEAMAVVDRVEASDPSAAVSVYLQAAYAMHEAANRPQAIGYFNAAQRIYDEHALDVPSQQLEILFGLGNTLIAEDRLNDAEPLLTRALMLGDSLYGPDHARMSGVLGALSSLERNRGNLNLAVAYSNRVVEIMRRSRSENYENLLTARNNLALALGKARQFDLSIAMLEEIVEIRRGMAPVEGSANLATSIKNLASIQHMAGRYEAALTNAQTSRILMERHLPTDSAYLATPHFTLALIYLDTGDPVAAESSARRSLELLLPALGEDHFQIAVNRCVLGEALLRQGRITESGPLITEALSALLATETRVPRYETRCASVADELNL